jgi:hypothetical protein
MIHWRRQPECKHHYPAVYYTRSHELERATKPKVPNASLAGTLSPEDDVTHHELAQAPCHVDHGSVTTTTTTHVTVHVTAVMRALSFLVAAAVVGLLLEDGAAVKSIPLAGYLCASCPSATDPSALVRAVHPA